MENYQTKRKVDIFFHRNGRIDLTSRVCRLLGITDGDIIDIYFDVGSKELYLYVSKPFSERINRVASWKNEVKQCKPNCNYKRVQSKDITNFVNRLTGSDESWLFVGAPRQVQKLGDKTALPVIYLNNQYKCTSD